jgi:hypothetical protein
MKRTARYLMVFVTVALVIAVSIWGPEAMARYKDKGILDKPHIEQIGEAGEGYRYRMNANEKLYILSQSLGSQVLPGSEQNALPYDSGSTELGSYAFVQNYKEPSGDEITDEQIYATCNDGLTTLKELNILPKEVREVNAISYDATLCSAIDVLEPRNNVAVWKLELSNSQKNADKENRLIDAYIDADDGKIYEFYARTSLLWEEIDTDAIIKAWANYIGLGAPAVYESDNPLLETTPFFRKYVFSGMGEGKTVVTVGYYEGIQELFLKIS